jgi:drug/metabolite transporter (DMT)-like permease
MAGFASRTSQESEATFPKPTAQLLSRPVGRWGAVPSPAWTWTTRWQFLFLCFVWGLNFIFLRVGLGYASPLYLSLLRAAVGAGGTALVLATLGGWGRLDARGRRDALLLGLPNTTVFYVLLTLSIKTVLPGLAAVVIYTFPLWVAVMSPTVLGHRLTVRHWIAIGVGFLGVALISQVWTALSGGFPLLAIGELLAAAVAWAMGTVLFQRRFSREQMREANALQLLGGTAGLLALVLLFGVTPFPSVTVDLGLTVVWLGILGTTFAYIIWFDLLGRTRAATLSAYVFLVPVVALAASALLFGERLGVVQLAGVALVFGSIYGIGRAPGANELVPDVEPALPD